jgi:hypothetical protein
MKNKTISLSIDIDNSIVQFKHKYGIEFLKSKSFITYDLYSQHTEFDDRDIASELSIINDTNTPQIYIETFFPNLKNKPNYEHGDAAAFFYIVLHHVSTIFGLKEGTQIELNSKDDQSKAFYKSLIDFKFIESLSPDEEHDLVGYIPSFKIDTSFIKNMAPNGLRSR